jgi:uncharacterized protein (TIGR00159 family)
MLPFTWQNAVDFLVLATVLYWVLLWARATRALRLALGIVGLHVAALAAGHYDLVITGWLLDGASLVGTGVLLIVFLPELRHALMQLDSTLRLGLYPITALRSAYRAIAEAAFQMARQRTGALIVIVRKNSVRELIEGGVSLRADISAELLETIFRPGSPLHDGAVIVEGERMVRAAALLPLSVRKDLPQHFGTRHRAAAGLAARSDALVIAVSEERGEVALFEDGRFQPMPDAPHLAARLQELQVRPRLPAPTRWRMVLVANWRIKLAALGLASLIWASFVVSSTSIKTVRLPVEFERVPVGLQIAEQSASSVEVQLRATPWVLGSLGSGISAHFDLRDAAEGTRTLDVGPESIGLPPGVIVERVLPPTITVRLVPGK